MANTYSNLFYHIVLARKAGTTGSRSKSKNVSGHTSAASLDAADVVIFNSGSGGFLVQKYYQKEWAENCMVHSWLTTSTHGGAIYVRWICPANLVSRSRRHPRCSRGASASHTSTTPAVCSGISPHAAKAQSRTDPIAMRKLIAAVNMTLNGFCDHTSMQADDEVLHYYVAKSGSVL